VLLPTRSGVRRHVRGEYHDGSLSPPAPTRKAASCLFFLKRLRSGSLTPFIYTLWLLHPVAALLQSASIRVPCAHHQRTRRVFRSDGCLRVLMYQYQPYKSLLVGPLILTDHPPATYALIKEDPGPKGPGSALRLHRRGYGLKLIW